ncbi:restriction endonuclease subunit S [Intestinibacter bartlettii]|uniref:restriction endonuclease subunit S n=1 Tax=Intestinibacter bartlettii TaxID=261299 RepID=UPI003522B031
MVPKLRFKEFCGEWDLKLLKDITEKIGDGLHGTPKYDENGEYFFINGNNIRNGKIIVLEENKKVGEDEFIKNDKGLDLDTVLMSINGTIGNLAYYNNEKVFLGKSVAYIKVSDEIKKQYLFQVLQTNSIQKYYTLSLTGTTIKNLGLEAIRNTKIKLPSLPEQTKIADFLSTVDDKIQNQQDKITHLENIKKGFMQKIFSRKIRFKDDSGEDFPEWEEKKIKDVFKITRGYVLSANNVEKNINKEYIYPVYSSQTKDKGLLGYYNEYLYEDAITWTTDGANAGTVHFRRGKFYCTNVCGVLISENGYANKCIAEMINRISKKYVSYVGNPKLMNNIMAEIKIDLPCLKEQQKISDILSLLDEKIDTDKETLEHLKQLKKGLLQQMFA